MSRRRLLPLGLADIHDFELGAGQEAAANIILQQPTVSLHSLDFANSQAVFVETPPKFNLSQAPFFYLAQYEHATRVLTLPFASMIALAQTMTVNAERLVFLYSVGRAGSTHPIDCGS